MNALLKKCLLITHLSAIALFMYAPFSLLTQSTSDIENASPENYTVPYPLKKVPTNPHQSTPIHLRSCTPYPPTHTNTSQFTRFKEVLSQRCQRVQTECSYIKLAPSRDTSRYLTVKSQSLTWCPTYKAASTLFMKIFVRLSGKLTPRVEKLLQEKKLQWNGFARTAFPRRQQPTFRELPFVNNRLLIVRHPFERLLSAYRDKLEHKEDREFYHRHYGLKIVKMYGDLSKHDVPTFKEFLQYVADKRPFDEHWRPYYLQCSPCYLDYNFILKTESLETEQEYLAYAINNKEFLSNSTVNKNPEGITDLSIAQKYFSTITHNLLQRVYEVYYIDFKLFDYSPGMYFNMTSE